MLHFPSVSGISPPNLARGLVPEAELTPKTMNSEGGMINVQAAAL